MVVLAGLLSVLAFAALVALLVARWNRQARDLRATRDRLARHQRFVEALREIAWMHRELDPNLSAVLVDEIRKFNKENP